jgi:hypothetical protein
MSQRQPAENEVLLFPLLGLKIIAIASVTVLLPLCMMIYQLAGFHMMLSKCFTTNIKRRFKLPIAQRFWHSMVLLLFIVINDLFIYFASSASLSLLSSSSLLSLLLISRFSSSLSSLLLSLALSLYSSTGHDNVRLHRLRTKEDARENDGRKQCTRTEAHTSACSGACITACAASRPPGLRV